MAGEQDYVDLGLSCVGIYKALERGMDGRELNELSEPVREAIDELNAWVERAMHISVHPFTMILIAGLSQISRRRSRNEAGATGSVDSCTGGTTKRQFQGGSQSSIGPFES